MFFISFFCRWNSSKHKIIISSIHDDNKDFQVDGFNVLALIYLSFGLSLWLGPSAVNIIGLRTSMTVASLFFTLNNISLVFEKEWLLYGAAVIGGVGAGLLWTAEGKYLVLSSEPNLVSQNIGIFWTFYSSSSFLGNIFTYYKLQGKEYIEQESRTLIICFLSTLSALATILFAFLRPIKKNTTQINQLKQINPCKELKKTWRVFTTKEMLVLSIVFLYTGLQQAFNSGIYSPCIGFTLQFVNRAKELVPLSGILVGVGQILGGCWQMLQVHLSKLSCSRRIIITSGIMAHLLSFGLVYINIPSSAVFGNTSDEAIVKSNIYLALFCSLLLGFGDGCLNTQNFSIIAEIFPEESAQSCALYKFIKAVFVAVGFSVSSYLNLHCQLKSLALMAISALISFIYIDINVVKSHNKMNKT
ncbi:UNC93-like protein MFSD11 isoform X2 [Lycorma delicatula]|uniref:UNC93-like protein MFSD11 isoform X2 n=1 Tax=Lycorma delicatula TaxID=130591 RepID=UPI003F50E9D7